MSRSIGRSVDKTTLLVYFRKQHSQPAAQAILGSETSLSCSTLRCSSARTDSVRRRRTRILSIGAQRCLTSSNGCCSGAMTIQLSPPLTPGTQRFASICKRLLAKHKRMSRSTWRHTSCTKGIHTNLTFVSRVVRYLARCQIWKRRLACFLCPECE